VHLTLLPFSLSECMIFLTLFYIDIFSVSLTTTTFGVHRWCYVADTMASGAPRSGILVAGPAPDHSASASGNTGASGVG
jgi:hypothetical protein